MRVEPVAGGVEGNGHCAGEMVGAHDMQRKPITAAACSAAPCGLFDEPHAAGQHERHDRDQPGDGPYGQEFAHASCPEGQAARRACSVVPCPDRAGSVAMEAHTAMPHVNSMSPTNAITTTIMVVLLLPRQDGTGRSRPVPSSVIISVITIDHPSFTGTCCLMKEIMGSTSSCV